MKNKIIFFFLNIIDLFYKKKLAFFLLKIFDNKKILILDIGAHKGESIDFFLSQFKIKKIFSFEPVYRNFLYLKKKYQSKNNSEVKIYNFGLSNKKEDKKINFTIDGQSSTYCNFNIQSKYLKKKIEFYFFQKKFYNKINTKLIRLDSFINKNKINNIDLLKIDTEGYELRVLQGLGNKFHIIKYIYFEHHYNNMFFKNYNFSDINYILKKNNFIKIFKRKMPFRKVFEYVYFNLRYQ